MTPRVFVSYSHKDEHWKDQLALHLGVLSREGALEVWDDRRIRAGDDWEKQIATALDGAAVAVLLISADFLTSDFVTRREIPQILAMRQRQGLRVVPVLVRPCAWKVVPWLAAIQIRPKDAKPLAGVSHYEAEAAMAAVSEEIYRFVGPVHHERANSNQPIPRIRPKGEIVEAQPACADRRHDVPARERKVISLALSKDETLVGRVRETTDQRFAYALVHEKSLSEYMAGNDDAATVFENGESSYEIDWYCRRNGPWFIVLDSKGKQYDRRVRVSLYRHSA